ncbi:MAG: hypothetical protein ABGF52_13435 [Candidatus Asgardarchaeum sp.]
MKRIRLFITCILTAFVALFNPKRVSKIFADHKRQEKKREAKRKKRWGERLYRMGPSIKDKRAEELIKMGELY